MTTRIDRPWSWGPTKAAFEYEMGTSVPVPIWPGYSSAESAHADALDKGWDEGEYYVIDEHGWKIPSIEALLAVARAAKAFDAITAEFPDDPGPWGEPMQALRDALRALDPEATP